MPVCLSVGLSSCPTTMRPPRARCCDSGIGYALAGGVAAAVVTSRDATSCPRPGRVWSRTGRQARAHLAMSVAVPGARRRRRQDGLVAGRDSHVTGMCVVGYWGNGGGAVRTWRSDSRVVRHATRCARRAGIGASWTDEWFVGSGACGGAAIGQTGKSLVAVVGNGRIKRSSRKGGRASNDDGWAQARRLAGGRDI